eukprot:10766253-Ditylum_brightwellii.AAC.1
MSDTTPLTNWRPMIDLIDQVGVVLVSLNDQMQTNVTAQSIGLLHTRFRQERQKRWILHCLSKEAHQAAVALDSANETAKTIVLNLVRSYMPGKPEDLVQIDKAQSSIRAMHQIALIGKALNQVIQQVDSLGAYRHVQMMTVEPEEPTLQ